KIILSEVSMQPVTLEQLRAFADELDGRTLVTRFRDRRFSLRVAPEGLEYTPEFSGMPRMQQWRWIERILARFNETQSLHPADYKDITVNASYILSILGGYLDSLRVAPHG